QRDPLAEWIVGPWRHRPVRSRQELGYLVDRRYACRAARDAADAGPGRRATRTLAAPNSSRRRPDAAVRRALPRHLRVVTDVGERAAAAGELGRARGRRLLYRPIGGAADARHRPGISHRAAR